MHRFVLGWAPGNKDDRFIEAMTRIMTQHNLHPLILGETPSLLLPLVGQIALHEVFAEELAFLRNMGDCLENESSDPFRTIFEVHSSLKQFTTWEKRNLKINLCTVEIIIDRLPALSCIDVQFLDDALAMQFSLKFGIQPVDNKPNPAIIG